MLHFGFIIVSWDVLCLLYLSFKLINLKKKGIREIICAKVFFFFLQKLFTDDESKKLFHAPCCSF